MAERHVRRLAGCGALTVLVILALLFSCLWLARDVDTAGPEYAYGLLPSPLGDYPTVALRTDAILPESVDLSAYMPPVGCQGTQPSCTAWAVGYYTRSYHEGLELGYVPVDDAQCYSPAYIYNQRPGDCTQRTGMSFVDGFDIAVNQGVCSLALMPYDENDGCTQPSDAARIEATQHRAQSYAALFLGSGNADLALIKQQLADGQPVLLGVPIYPSFRVTQDHPAVEMPQDGEVLLGLHALTAVGYDDAAQTFKFVNSWSTNWGFDGYGFMSYEFMQECVFEAWVLYDAPTEMPTPEPTIPVLSYRVSLPLILGGE